MSDGDCQTEAAIDTLLQGGGVPPPHQKAVSERGGMFAAQGGDCWAVQGTRKQQQEPIGEQRAQRGELPEPVGQHGPVIGVVDLTGNLCRKALFGWKSQFYVLAFHNGQYTLHSYMDHTCQKDAGSIPIGRHTRLSASTAREYSFCIETASDAGTGGAKHKPLLLAANSHHQWQQWEQTLTQVIGWCVKQPPEEDRSALGERPPQPATESRTLGFLQSMRRATGSSRQATAVNEDPDWTSIGTRYTDLRPIGQGTFGLVMQAHDTLLNRSVAIKRTAFPSTDRIRDAARVVRELRLLRSFRHPNIVRLKDIFLGPEQSHRFSHVFFIMEHMDTNLHRIIYSKQVLSDQHMKYIMYQIACGVRHLHAAGVIHRDLKPGNILVNEQCQAKICDFGLSRGTGVSAEQARADEIDIEGMTEYVVTRWYRAPEVVLCSGWYSFAVDVWGVGCIFAEMARRKPLFRGKHYMDHLRRIFRVIGTPQEWELGFVSNPKAREFVLGCPQYTRRPMSDVIPVDRSTLASPPVPPGETSAPPSDGQAVQEPSPLEQGAAPDDASQQGLLHADALSLLDSIFVLHPLNRPTADALVQHVYFDEFRNEALERVMPAGVIEMNDIEEITALARMRSLVLHETDLAHTARAHQDAKMAHRRGRRDRTRGSRQRRSNTTESAPSSMSSSACGSISPNASEKQHVDMHTLVQSQTSLPHSTPAAEQPGRTRQPESDAVVSTHVEPSTAAGELAAAQQLCTNASAPTETLEGAAEDVQQQNNNHALDGNPPPSSETHNASGERVQQTHRLVGALSTEDTACPEDAPSSCARVLTKSAFGHTTEHSTVAVQESSPLHDSLSLATIQANSFVVSGSNAITTTTNSEPVPSPQRTTQSDTAPSGEMSAQAHGRATLRKAGSDVLRSNI